MLVWKAMQANTQASLLAFEVDNLIDQALSGEVSAEESDALLDQAIDLEEQVGINEELSDVSQDMADLTDELTTLGDQLWTGADGASGAGSIEAMSTTEIEDRMTAIQDELEFLYMYEELLLEELDDPMLGTVDSFWVEWDLWDVEFDIDDLEVELGSLQGEAFDRSFDTDALWDSYMGSFATAIDGFLNLFDAEFQLEKQAGAEESVNDNRRVIRQIASQRLEQAQTQGKIERDTVELQRTENRGVALTDAVKKSLIEMQPLVSQLMAEPNRAVADQLRQQINAIRGPRSS